MLIGARACRMLIGALAIRSVAPMPDPRRAPSIQVLAKENPQTPQSIRYFARLLDVDSDGSPLLGLDFDNTSRISQLFTTLYAPCSML